MGGSRNTGETQAQDGERVSVRHNDGRVVVTLSSPVAKVVRRMSNEMGGVPNAEVVRRGLILLDFLQSLAEGEELVVRDRDTDRCDRIRFSWELLPDHPGA